MTHGRLNFWRLTEAWPWDVDGVVNANVIHHLGSRPEAQPVADHLASALANRRAASCDKWHRNECAFLYAVSRALASGVAALEPMRGQLAEHAEAALDGELYRPRLLLPPARCSTSAARGCARPRAGAPGGEPGRYRRMAGLRPVLGRPEARLLLGLGGPHHGFGHRGHRPGERDELRHRDDHEKHGQRERVRGYGQRDGQGEEVERGER